MLLFCPNSVVIRTQEGENAVILSEFSGNSGTRKEKCCYLSEFSANSYQNEAKACLNKLCI
jgi:hypothetical protein